MHFTVQVAFGDSPQVGVVPWQGGQVLVASDEEGGAVLDRGDGGMGHPDTWGVS